GERAAAVCGGACKANEREAMNLEIYSHVFEGSSLTTIMYKGRPCWIARDVGAWLGYSRGGNRLADKVRGEWGEEFIAGADYESIAGKDLRDLKELIAQTTDSGVCAIGTNVNALMVLFEPGLHLVLAKTSK